MWILWGVEINEVRSNSYKPFLRVRFMRMTWVTWSLTKQELGKNSKYTLLSFANLETLGKFFFSMGTWSKDLRAKSFKWKGLEKKDSPMF